MNRSFAALSLGLTLVAACAGDTPEPANFHADTGGEATGDAAEPRVVARLTTAEDAAVVFMAELDDAAPVISIEIASPNETPTLDALLAQEPSALELHLALAPGRTPPPELVAEHARLAEADPAYAPAPRHLVPETVAGSAIVEPFSCVNNYAGWFASFDAWAPDLAGEYAATNVGTTTGYVGYAPKFYFDVCRITSGAAAYAVRTERRSNSAAAWGIFDNGPLGLNQRYRFFRNSFTCTSYQWRLYVNPNFGSYHRGAKWSNEWSCQIQG